MSFETFSALADQLVVFNDPVHTVVYSLDGVNYTFRWLYCTREDRWYTDVFTEDGTPLVYGIKLVQGVDLLELVVDARAPRGMLAVFPLVEGAGDPGLNDFVGDGATCGLFYVPLENFA